MSKYIITQTRKDAIGIVQENLLKDKSFTEIHIKWFKNMLLSHVWELIRTPFIGWKLKPTDVVLSCNSKSIHPHLLPYFTKAKIYQLHYHFDDRMFGLHRLPFFSYNKLFKQVHTIFTNTHMKDIAVSQYGCQNWSIVPLAINHNIFQDIGLPRSPHLCLYVGSFGHRKNIKRLLKAFSGVVDKIPTAQLLICNGSMGSYDMIEKDLITLGIEKNIIYESDVPLERLVYAYNKASVFVFPTLVEGFGLPLVESMACGCKVVTSDLPVHKEITKGLETYVNPLDCNSIADGILEAFKRTETNQKQTFSYNWSRTLQQIKEVLE